MFKHLASEFVGMENLDYTPRSIMAIGIVEAVKALITKSSTSKETEATITHLIQKHTHMNVSFRWMSERNAYCQPEALDKNHIFWQERARLFESFDEGADYGKIADGLGGVNLANGTVSGALTKIKFKLRCGKPDKLITSTKSVNDIARRVSAVIFHELGHAFTNCIYFGRASTTNLILAELYARWRKMPKSSRYSIISSLEKSKSIQGDNSRLANTEDPDLVVVSITNNHFTTLASEVGEDIYTKRGCEALADQYAARLGFASDLALALRDIGDMGTTAQVYIYRSLRGILTFAFLWSAPVILALGLVGLVFILELLAPEAGDEYDTGERRIEVLENELKRQLALDHDSKTRNILLQSLSSIREMDAKDYTLSTFHLELLRLVMPGTRARHNNMILQKKLEDLTASELYVSKAKLEKLNED